MRVANELADKTSEAHNYQAAATIYLEYLNNPMEAARILCTGFLYDEAIRIVSRQGEASGPLFKSTIDPGLLEGFAQISELLADCNSQIKSQVNRINELRTKKLKIPMPSLPMLMDLVIMILIFPTMCLLLHLKLLQRHHSSRNTLERLVLQQRLVHPGALPKPSS